VIWVNPQLAGKIPNTLLKAFLYFRKLLQAESPEHLTILTRTTYPHDPRTTPIANRWQTILASSLTNLPPGPPPLQLLLPSKQLDITTSLERRVALITQTNPTIPRPPPIQFSINPRPNRRTKTNTHTTHPLSPSQVQLLHTCWNVPTHMPLPRCKSTPIQRHPHHPHPDIPDILH